jgi:hypothetical protein
MEAGLADVLHVVYVQQKVDQILRTVCIVASQLMLGNRVLEKITFDKQIKKFPAFHRLRRFITDLQKPLTV